MKKYFFFLTAISLVPACTPQEQYDPGSKIVHVTDLSLSHKSISIKEGESFTLEAFVIPNNADNKAVTWTTTSEEIAYVDDGGRVTGIAAGNATILAITEDGSKWANCTVKVTPNLEPSVTVGSDHVSAISAMLIGKVNVGETVASDFKVGFQYSKSAGILPSNSITVEAKDVDADYNYATGITGLDPETTYYFRTFVRQNGQDTYGETKEFETKEFVSLLETRYAKSIRETSANLIGFADLSEVKYVFQSINYGFYYGVSEETQDAHIGGDSGIENTFSASLSHLSQKTQYWYKAYVNLDGQVFYGGVKTFTTDPTPVECITLDREDYVFKSVGNTLQLKATIFPADATDKSIEWSSDNEQVAIVDQTGEVTACGVGKATITATVKEQGKAATCEITVPQLVTDITLDKTSLSLLEGETYTLGAAVTPEDARIKTLTWTSSSTDVATVDDMGKITAVAKGTAVIMAEANDGSGVNATCSVEVNRLVSSIALSKTALTLYRGSSNVVETISAMVSPSTASDPGVNWTSSDTSVATVDNGIIVGIAPGKATIKASARDESGVSSACEVEVIQFVTDIAFDKPSLTIMVGDTQTLTPIVSPANANNHSLTWTSADPSIATVDNNGKVIAVAKGTTTIFSTAIDGNHMVGSCPVLVFEDKEDMGIRTAEGKTLYWATRNICETGFVGSPVIYGDYYAWGETETYYSNLDPLIWKEGKTGYNEESYRWFDGGSLNALTKYNTKTNRGTVDNLVVLQPEDDAASVKLGGKWRIPTKAEWEALIATCNYRSVSNYNNTGVNGGLFIAPNGNSIFIPMAGRLRENSVEDVGRGAFYLSSSLYTENPTQAYLVYLGYPSYSRFYTPYRDNGYSIRPVSE